MTFGEILIIILSIAAFIPPVYVGWKFSRGGVSEGKTTYSCPHCGNRHPYTVNICPYTHRRVSLGTQTVANKEYWNNKGFRFVLGFFGVFILELLIVIGIIIMFTK